MPESPVRASLRASIAWSGGEPFEDTDTLVITINGYSLDLRVFISGAQKGEIDWASVGRVHEVANDSGKPVLRWDNILDSRPPTDLPDEGTFETQADGDVLETGTMYNPKSGKNETFVERWRRYPKDAGWEYYILERVDSNWGEGERNRAFLGRLGPRALGIAKVDGKVVAWRDELENGEWKRQYEFAEGLNLDEIIPAVPLKDMGGKEGGTIQHDGAEWLARSCGQT